MLSRNDQVGYVSCADYSTRAYATSYSLVYESGPWTDYRSARYARHVIGSKPRHQSTARQWDPSGRIQRL